VYVLCQNKLLFRPVNVKPSHLSPTDLYRLSGDGANEEEECRQHTNFSQSLLKDHFQSSQLSEHGLIQVNSQH